MCSTLGLHHILTALIYFYCLSRFTHINNKVVLFFIIPSFKGYALNEV